MAYPFETDQERLCAEVEAAKRAVSSAVVKHSQKGGGVDAVNAANRRLVDAWSDWQDWSGGSISMSTCPPNYKSTGTTEVRIVERDSDGTTRAVQNAANGRQWKAQLEHPSPSGPVIRPCSTIYGDRGDVTLALSHYLN